MFRSIVVPNLLRLPYPLVLLMINSIVDLQRCKLNKPFWLFPEPASMSRFLWWLAIAACIEFRHALGRQRHVVRAIGMLYCSAVHLKIKSTINVTTGSRILSADLHREAGNIFELPVWTLCSHGPGVVWVFPNDSWRLVIYGSNSFWRAMSDIFPPYGANKRCSESPK